MKNLLSSIKWLAQLAEGKPIVFAVVLLMIAVVAETKVIINRDNKIDNCDDEKRSIVRAYEHRLDSTNIANKTEITNLNLEIKETLLSVVEDAKDALEEQKTLNRKMNTTISRTSKLNKRVKSRIKNLR